MKTSIYQILMGSNPQTLQDLDRLQMKCYGCHIQRRELEIQPVTVKGQLETSEEIDRLMRQPRSRE